MESQYIIDPILENGLGIPNAPASLSDKLIKHEGEKWGKKFGKTEIVTHSPFVRSVLEVGD
ncbi:hypothetical protein [Schleiferilactobacillus perolens]|uniref:hypothetical protein n=1 Tax=Schleiferilactobacillus perolens TaxID=100468 RepID=UPI0039EC2B09